MALHKKQALPTWRDLPLGDGIPMDNGNHPIQAERYLKEPLEAWLAEHGRTAFMGTNCFLYYEVGRRPAGPDFFVVKDGKNEQQGSWVVYSEGGLKPTLVCEFLSPTSQREDRTTKKERYRKLGVPDYVLYDTETQHLEVYHLRGELYVPAEKDENGRVQCESLPLKVGPHGKWLRWFTADGLVVPTTAERREQDASKADREQALLRQEAADERQRREAAQRRAEAEQQRADAERQRADAAERRLKELEKRLSELE